MDWTNGISFTATVLFLCLLFGSTHSQYCVKDVEKAADILEQAYYSSIVIRAKVTVPSKSYQTAEVTSIFDTKNGGLAVGDTIVFGPVPKVKKCTRMRKGVEYILFLEDKAPGTDQYRITYDPQSKASQAKRLKKVLCEGCVKPPKFKDSDKRKTLEEGESFNFNCKVSGNPKPVAKFLKDGSPIESKEIKIKLKKKGGGGRLKIAKVKLSHAGVYTCEAANVDGNASLAYKLVVRPPPPTEISTPPTINITTTSTIISTTTSTGNCIPCKKDKRSLCFFGTCCMLPGGLDAYCKCKPGYQGERCGDKTLPSISTYAENPVEARYHQQTVAIMGVCIALLVVLLICYIVYVQFKKSRKHIKKEILARNGHVNTNSSVRSDERPITNASPEGIVASNSPDSDVVTTGYRSTNLNETPTQGTAFSQTITYEDVLPTRTETQPLMSPNDNHHVPYAAQANGRRKRKNAVAVESSGKHSHSASDADVKHLKRVGELKDNRASIISSSSSIGSHHDMRRPTIPIDERLGTMAMIPPSYSDLPDGGHAAHSSGTDMGSTSQYSVGRPESHHSPQAQVNRDNSISPQSIGAHSQRVNSVDNNERTGEEPVNSPTFLTDSYYLPKSDQNIGVPSLASEESHSGHYTPKSMLYHTDGMPTAHPFNEHHPDHYSPNMSGYCHDNDDKPRSSSDATALLYDSNQRRSQPSSPRQYQNNPGMGMPFHHAPVTVASARTHHLPLLTKENSDSTSEQHNRFPTRSLSSSSSDVSYDTEHNRNSHKIEV